MVQIILGSSWMPLSIHLLLWFECYCIPIICPSWRIPWCDSVGLLILILMEVGISFLLSSCLICDNPALVSIFHLSFWQRRRVMPLVIWLIGFVQYPGSPLGRHPTAPVPPCLRGRSCNQGVSTLVLIWLHDPTALFWAIHQMSFSQIPLSVPCSVWV